MKKLLIILSIIGMFGCRTTKVGLDSRLNYSDYESAGGFNYMEDVIEVFYIDTMFLNPEPHSSLDTL